VQFDFTLHVTMENNSKKKAVFFGTLDATAFLVNFCWESLHGLLYHAHPEMPAAVYVPMMLSMAAMDTFCIMGLYCITALVFRTWFWIPSMNNSSLFFVLGLIAAYAVEYLSIFIFHLWQYQSSMPVVFGVGLFPLIQLSFTGLFSVFVARKVAADGL